MPHPDGDSVLILIASPCGAGIKSADSVGLKQPGQSSILGGNLSHLMAVIVYLVLYGTQMMGYRPPVSFGARDQLKPKGQKTASAYNNF
ncbi:MULTISPECIES: hypothetical protein [Edwardsiella]|uniref:Uncharacterized protein n=2 Tax=Edwardsiella anguillarum TaxID=1821960 RepID=A0A076LUG9_9GAMM|nr:MULTISPECIES: hypothetical protein [Edwardsiella]AIJ10103.1 Hypothetical protein ETEE_3691 [Edwardsiella anguillarum ET080813]AKR77698.2 hypothetical protein AAZ33_08550 [Edwardsiella sp. LADL05-105]UOU80959.1 hypothetical protein MUN71_09730 [Edwardsiella anguillarum]WHP85858.1 hypothetical protein MQ095_09190 [Edwardsiella anguillarum]WHP89654.1 hypothetical protein MQ088_09200 [Edwardsiella anguillarum]